MSLSFFGFKHIFDSVRVFLSHTYVLIIDSSYLSDFGFKIFSHLFKVNDAVGHFEFTLRVLRLIRQIYHKAMVVNHAFRVFMILKFFIWGRSVLPKTAEISHFAKLLIADYFD